MKGPWGEKDYKYFYKKIRRQPSLNFFDYLRIFFSEGFGWLILGLIALCGLVYLFGGNIK